MAGSSVSQTRVKTSKLVQLADCSLHNKTLLGGQILKWMDIVSCLAGQIFFDYFFVDIHQLENIFYLYIRAPDEI